MAWCSQGHENPSDNRYCATCGDYLELTAAAPPDWTTVDRSARRQLSSPRERMRRRQWAFAGASVALIVIGAVVVAISSHKADPRSTGSSPTGSASCQTSPRSDAPGGLGTQQIRIDAYGNRVAIHAELSPALRSPPADHILLLVVRLNANAADKNEYLMTWGISRGRPDDLAEVRPVQRMADSETLDVGYEGDGVTIRATRNDLPDLPAHFVWTAQLTLSSGPSAFLASNCVNVPFPQEIFGHD